MLRFVVARHKTEIYQEYLEQSFKNMNVRVYGVDGDENIYHKYNLGIQEHIKDNLTDDEIVCFCHEDVKIIDNEFVKKIEYIFTKPHIGLVGVIGALELNDSCSWWSNPSDKLFGHIVQENGPEEFHLVKGKIGYTESAVCVDGLFFAVRGKVLKDGLRFREEWNTWHHYDVSFCLDVLTKTDYKIAIVDIMMKHKSPGMGSLTEDWKKSKEILKNSINTLNLTFPINSKTIEDWKLDVFSTRSTI